jgi:hypothetical protein
MAYYLSAERNQDVVGAYRRYQEYLRQHQREFPPGAYALATAEWYQNPSDPRCPHDGRVENFIMSQTDADKGKRIVTVRIRLLGAYHDGYVELFYPQVFKYTLESPSCGANLGDWLCDEFRLSSSRHLVHEIEWVGLAHGKQSRWIIEASDIEFRWITASDPRGGPNSKVFEG